MEHSEGFTVVDSEGLKVKGLPVVACVGGLRVVLDPGK